MRGQVKRQTECSELMLLPTNKYIKIKINLKKNFTQGPS